METTTQEPTTRTVPSPVVRTALNPTLRTGIEAMLAAAGAWLTAPVATTSSTK